MKRLLALGAVALMGGAVSLRGASVPDDDLQAVRRAVAQAEPAPSAPPAATRTEPAAPRRLRAEPQWLRVRVEEKGSKKSRVKVNLPLSLVRILGDQDIDWRCHRAEHRRCAVKLSEILEALEAGQDLVEIEDEDATVRVWVD